MPNSYMTYALAALTFGLAVAFVRLSDENSVLARDNLALELQFEKVQGEAKNLRDKYSTESKAREFAEAALTLAETSERAIRTQLTHETKSREAAERIAQDAQAAKQTADAALVDAQEQIRVLTAKIEEASAAKAQTDRQSNAAAGAMSDPTKIKEEVRVAETAPPAAAEASMTGGKRSWFSFFGWF